MAATRARRLTSRLFSPALLVGAVLACSGSSGSSSTPSSPHPPQLANFAVFPDVAAVDQGGGAISVGFGAEELDVGADVNRATVTIVAEDGTKVSELSEGIQNPPGVTHSSLGGEVIVPTGAAGAYTVRFQIFDAGGSGSNVVEAPFHVVPGNPAPAIASLSPSSAAAGTASLVLTVTGSGFLPSSTIFWNGGSLATTYVDASTLRGEVSAYQLSYSGTAQVTVWNPPPGGGQSAPYPFTVDPPPPSPVPTITAISPASAVAGSPALTLTVTGTGFVGSSSVQWNGSYLTTTVVDSTTLQAQVPAYWIYAGTVQITVWNPPPGGGSSNAWTFTIDPQPPSPAPTLTAISPTSVDAGAPSVTLAVTGTGFVASSSVQWNSMYVPTTYVDATTLQAVVPGYWLTNVGTANVAVYTPSPGGGTSASLPFAIRRPAIQGVTAVSLQANDLAWDPYQRKLYASVPSASPVNPNTVTVVDPFTGELGASQFAGSEPGPISLSDDGQFLYVGLGGASSVARLLLPGLGRDLDIVLGRDPNSGPYYARDLEAAPGAPDTLAVSLTANVGYYGSSGGIAIFDDAAARPTRIPGTSGSFTSLQWGADASALYASSTDYLSNLYTMSVDASGAVLTHSWTGAFTSYGTRIHFDRGTGLLYGDDGHAVDPSTGLPVGTFTLTGLNYSPTYVAPDSSLGSAFFVGRTSSWSQLRAYDLQRYVQRASLDLPYVASPAGHLVRFGQDGVAFLTPAEVVLVRGAIVLPVSQSANPAPAASSLAPSGAVPGAANLRLTVSGSGFVAGSVVRWNGSERTTRFVDATRLVAYIPASDVAAAGSAEVTVASPAPGGGTSDALTFTIAP